MGQLYTYMFCEQPYVIMLVFTFVTLEQCKHWLTYDVATILVSVNVYSCAYSGMCSVVMKAH